MITRDAHKMEFVLTFQKVFCCRCPNIKLVQQPNISGTSKTQTLGAPSCCMGLVFSPSPRMNFHINYWTNKHIFKKPASVYEQKAIEKQYL